MDNISAGKLSRQELSAELGKRIKQARLEADMSQLQVAIILGVSDKTISGYESGRISPAVDKLHNLADLFKKPLSFFFGHDPKDYRIAARLRAVEVTMRELREQLREIKLLCEENKID